MRENNFFKGKVKIIVILAIIIGILVLPPVMYRNFLNTPVGKGNEDVEFKVYRGANSNTIIENLSEKGLINNKIFAKLYLKNHSIDKSLRVGVYKFNTSMTPVGMFNKLLKGETDPDAVIVTIPEGYTVKRIAQKLFSAGLIKSVDTFLNECQNGKFNYGFINDIPSNRPSRLEGYLFPDTYEFRRGMSEHEIIDKMISNFSTINASFIEQGDNLDEKIIVASIVEGEAKVKEERPIISAVFYNRLRKNMNLQSCATVEYALGKHKDVLYYKDLAIDSPYNTYKYNGLPVGPINNPGKSALEAAFNPSNVDYIYFVAKGDGTHYFTNDYGEFLKYKNLLKQ